MHDFVTESENRLIERIVNRAMSLDRTRRPAAGLIDRITLTSELVICHKYACRLDLAKLAAAPDPVFTHDLFGIRDHLDHDKRELRDCFTPRCAAPERAGDTPDGELFAPEAANLNGTSEPGLHDLAGSPGRAGRRITLPPAVKIFVVIDATGAAVSGPFVREDEAAQMAGIVTALKPCRVGYFMTPLILAGEGA